MRATTVPTALISIGAGFAFYAICDADVWLFAFASILVICAVHELLATLRSNQPTQRGNR